MYNRKTDRDLRCPLEYGLELFGGKWNSRVICGLNCKDGIRYSELRKALGNVTDAVLTTTLKELVNSGMIERRSYDEIPPRVEYSLTEKGKSAIPILRNMCQWASTYYEIEYAKLPDQCRKCGNCMHHQHETANRG